MRRNPIEPANGNLAQPIVSLTPSGDGRALYRALARVVVRRELMSVTAAADLAGCDAERIAG